MPQTIIKLLHEASTANKADKFRKGNVITLPDQGQLVISGDIHGHRRNFERLINVADLQNHPERHILLQEIIHGGLEDSQGGCLSFELLFEAARYKIKFPDQVHIIMGNHDTVFINDTKVMKNGKEMNRAMRMGLDRRYPKNSKDIQQAIKKFMITEPLALRTQNRIWLSHSLPADRYFDEFDPTVMHKDLDKKDIAPKGSVYHLTWGRNHSQQGLDRMAQVLDVDIFILGHQPQTEGFKKAGDNLIIISSEHNHGCFLLIDLEKTYNVDKLVDIIVPLASIA